MTRRRAVGLLRLVLLLGAGICVLALLVRVGPGPAGAPPLGGSSGGPGATSFAGWWRGSHPLDAVAALLRLLAIAVCAYLVAVTALHLLAASVRERRIGRVATLLGPRFLAGLAATAVLGTGTAGAATSPGPTAAPDTSGASAAPPTMEVVTAPSGGATWLPWAEDAAPVATVVTTAATAAQVPDPPPPPPPTSASSEVTVQRGDSFWTIAEAELASRSASTPTDAEVAPYWRAVIELNEHLLVEPGNPDLIYPGQVFQLPQ